MNKLTFPSDRKVYFIMTIAYILFISIAAHVIS